jgi:hypothetical protein
MTTHSTTGEPARLPPLAAPDLPVPEVFGIWERFAIRYLSLVKD